MIDRERYALAADIFQRACEVSPEQRGSFLKSTCGDDRELRGQVEELLAHDGVHSVFFDEPFEPATVDTAVSGAPPPAAREPDLSEVGSYKVVEPLGRGGMGVVYRARQSRPDREVALKLIRPELLNESAIRRLEREAELLGRLQHPGIAQIYEAGHSRVRDSDGIEFDQPFLAMELVDGRPICRYVADNRLDARDVARLMLPICEAVQHAHQRGVLHLDLKPANILLDESGRPRVLDFGVSQAIETLPQQLVSRSRDVAGTLAYMSPEQILGRNEDFDTRTDIYALGALAFELLSGRPLHDFTGVALEDAILRLVVAPEPDLADAVPGISAELAAVVQRAMARNKDDRYASVGEFAADLGHYLSYEPVQALPSRIMRTLRLFARRNTVPAIAGALACTVAAVGLSALVIGLVRASHSAEQARQANEAARAQAENAHRMADFLESTILGVDPEERGPHATFFDAIDYAASRVHRDLTETPEVEADVRFSLGFVYRRHGIYAKAEDQFRQTLQLRERLYGLSDARTLEVLEELGYLAYLYAGDFDQAARLLSRALATYDDLDLAHSEAAAWVAMKLGLVELAADNLARAEALFARAREPLVRTYGAAYKSRPLRELARCALRRNELDRAETLAREALRACAEAEEQEYIAGRVRLTLAQILVAARNPDGAREMIDAAEDGLAQRLPADHPEMSGVVLTRARIALAAGRRSAANDYAQRAWNMATTLLAAGHADIIEAEAVLVQTGPAELMLAGLEQLFGRAESELGADHWLTIRILDAIVARARESGDDSAARRHQEVLQTLTLRRSERLRTTAGDSWSTERTPPETNGAP